MTQEEIKGLKGQGFLFNKDKAHFSARIITENGVITAKQLQVISKASEEFGNGNVALTTRMTVEVTGITPANVPKMKAYIEQEGMVIGGTGAKVRPIVACKGTVCVFGLCDTQGVATEIHKRFYEGYGAVTLPHKFKIAVGGCPNNCVKPELNDIGLVGQRVTKVNEATCKQCSNCGVEKKCPMGAITRTQGQVVYDRESCNNCSRCIGHCPFGAVEPTQTGYRIYVGGRWGKQTRKGDLLEGVYSKEEALDMIEKAILLFKEQGVVGERFGTMIDRLGIQYVQQQLQN